MVKNQNFPEIRMSILCADLCSIGEAGGDFGFAFRPSIRQDIISAYYTYNYSFDILIKLDTGALIFIRVMT